MSTVAVLCAMDKELERFITDYNATLVSHDEKIYKTELGGNTVYSAVCGIGKVNSALTTQKLIDRYAPDVVINCGVAGGLDKSLSVLDTVIVEKAQYHDFSPLSLLEEDENLKTSVFECDKNLIAQALDACKSLHESGKIGNYILGKVVSGDCFVESDEMSRRLREDFGAACVEMEGASIAHVCLVNRTRCLILRSISDFADNSAEMSYESFVSRAAEQSVRVLGELISRI